MIIYLVTQYGRSAARGVSSAQLTGFSDALRGILEISVRGLPGERRRDGKYLNPDTTAFEAVLRSDFFVDQTELLTVTSRMTDTCDRYLAILRPDGFGKTTAAEMICAFYGREAKAGELFSSCAVAQREDWDHYLGAYNVIRIDMEELAARAEDVRSMISLLESELVGELQERYGCCRFDDPQDLVFSLENLCDQTDDQFVVVIDNYDSVFWNYRDDAKGQRDYTEFLTVLRGDRAWLALACITGILPIRKYGYHSPLTLNMFEELSMLSPGRLAGYTGFNDEEVRALCVRVGRDVDDAQAIENWYGGYALFRHCSPRAGRAPALSGLPPRLGCAGPAGGETLRLPQGRRRRPFPECLG